MVRIVAIGLALVALARPAYPAEVIPELLRQTYWGEGSEDLARQFGAAAIKLPRGFDFGDSYANLVLDGTVGGVPVVVFFQMDKVTRGLRRIQLERPRHGVNPPAFRVAIPYRARVKGVKPAQTGFSHLPRFSRTLLPTPRATSQIINIINILYS